VHGADLAVYQAKLSGRNRICRYTAGETNTVTAIPPQAPRRLKHKRIGIRATANPTPPRWCFRPTHLRHRQNQPRQTPAPSRWMIKVYIATWWLATVWHRDTVIRRQPD
jgi:hypothetical protein